jgi:hypothetical protein
MERVGSVQEFFVLEYDADDIVMGVQWHNSLVGKHRPEMTRLVDIDTHGFCLPNPVDMTQDLAPDDELMEQSTVEDFLENSREAWESCYNIPDFLQLDRLLRISSILMGRYYFNHLIVKV